MCLFTHYFIKFFWRSKTRSFALMLMKLLPIKKGRVMAICWGGKNFSCNPRAIIEEIISSKKLNKFDIYIALLNPDSIELPEGVHSVQLGSLEYFELFATSQFIISNIRLAGEFFPYKKEGQLYVQTMHGPHGVKKVEFDVTDSLSSSYLKLAEEDSRRADIFLSNSKMTTDLYRSAYHFYGEILEEGLPRNHVFFAPQIDKNIMRQHVFDFLQKQKNVPVDAMLLLYTPTFRSNGRKDVYGFNVDDLINALESRFGGKWYIAVSSHPNMLSYYMTIYDFSHPRLLDVGQYPDLHELMVVSEAMITDYSASSIDFILTRRPVFQLIRDIADYDRGTYINPKELPFPYSEDDCQLRLNILNFDDEKYQRDLDVFNNEKIGLKENGKGAEAIVTWMENRLID